MFRAILGCKNTYKRSIKWCNLRRLLHVYVVPESSYRFSAVFQLIVEQYLFHRNLFCVPHCIAVKYRLID